MKIWHYNYSLGIHAFQTFLNNYIPSKNNSGPFYFIPGPSLLLFDSTSEMKYSLFYLYMIKPLPLNQCENIQNALQHHQMSPLEDDSPFGSARLLSGNKDFFGNYQ